MSSRQEGKVYMHVEYISAFCPETRQTFLTPISFAVYDEESKQQPTVYVRRFSRYRLAHHAVKKNSESDSVHAKQLYGNDYIHFRDYLHYIGADKAKTVVRSSDTFMDSLYSFVKENQPISAQSYLLTQLLGLPIGSMRKAILPRDDFREYQALNGTPCSKVMFLASKFSGQMDHKPAGSEGQVKPKEQDCGQELELAHSD